MLRLSFCWQLYFISEVMHFYVNSDEKLTDATRIALSGVNCGLFFIWAVNSLIRTPFSIFITFGVKAQVTNNYSNHQWINLFSFSITLYLPFPRYNSCRFHPEHFAHEDNFSQGSSIPYNEPWAVF